MQCTCVLAKYTSFEAQKQAHEFLSLQSAELGTRVMCKEDGLAGVLPLRSSLAAVLALRLRDGVAICHASHLACV